MASIEEFGKSLQHNTSQKLKIYDDYTSWNAKENVHKKMLLLLYHLLSSITKIYHKSWERLSKNISSTKHLFWIEIFTWMHSKIVIHIYKLYFARILSRRKLKISIKRGFNFAAKPSMENFAWIKDKQ